MDIIQILDAIFRVTHNSPMTKYFDSFKENNGLDYLESILVTDFKTKYWNAENQLIQDLNDPNSSWAKWQSTENSQEKINKTY